MAYELNADVPLRFYFSLLSAIRHIEIVRQKYLQINRNLVLQLYFSSR